MEEISDEKWIQQLRLLKDEGSLKNIKIRERILEEN